MTTGDDALTGFATGNRKGKPAARNQSVLTPLLVVDLCKALWGQIALDPCWEGGAITDPEYKFDIVNGQDGTKLGWVPKTFINPPYDSLQPWLEHGRKQPLEQVWLIPVRSHRRWWRKFRDEHLDVYVELNPIKFLGYQQFFPAPLLLGYTGNQVADFFKYSEPLGGRYMSVG